MEYNVVYNIVNKININVHTIYLNLKENSIALIVLIDKLVNK